MIPEEALQAVRQRVIPKLGYALKTTLFSKTQCQSYNTVPRKICLALMGLNRNYPEAVLYAPPDYDSIEFPNMEYLQNQTQLEYWLKQLRWGKTVSNDFKVTLARVQLRSGFMLPVLYETKPPITYINGSYILDQRKRMGTIGDASLWVEDARTPT